jgi:hypothetical protein
MVGGVVVSVLVGAVGAILDYAVTENPYQHGVNLNTVGVILMIVGAVGVVLSVLFGLVGPGGFHRRRTVIDDGSGRVVRREDSYI